MTDHRITQLELQTRRRSSSRSSNSAGGAGARASITSTGNVSPVRTIASRSSTHSIIVVKAPPTLLTSVTPTTTTSSQKRISRLSSGSLHDSTDHQSEKCDQSSSKTGKMRQALTSSFLRRKRVEYAGIDSSLYLIGVVSIIKNNYYITKPFEILSLQ